MQCLLCNSTLSNHEIIKTDDSREELKTENFEFQSLTPKERTVAVALWNVTVLQEQYCVLKESTAHGAFRNCCHSANATEERKVTMNPRHLT